MALEGVQVALRRRVCGFEGVSGPEEGACGVLEREVLRSGWPWGHGGVVLSREEAKENDLEGWGRPVCFWGVGVPVVMPCNATGVCAVWRVSLGKWFEVGFAMVVLHLQLAKCVNVSLLPHRCWSSSRLGPWALCW